MDPRRFDSHARSYAAPKTRRGLLGGLAALGAGILGARAVDAQVSQVQCGNQACASNPGGCRPGCVCCLYTNPVTGQVTNSRCRLPGTCSPGTQVGATPTTTTTAAPPCASSAQCPAGHACFNGGCFQLCSKEFSSCPGCGGCECKDLKQFTDSHFCLDTATFVGLCQSDVDCPTGTACSAFTDGGGVQHLCTYPCCAVA